MSDYKYISFRAVEDPPWTRAIRPISNIKHAGIIEHGGQRCIGLLFRDETHLMICRYEDCDLHEDVSKAWDWLVAEFEVDSTED